MGSLVSLEHALKESVLYFRNTVLNSLEEFYKLKSEYPFAIHLHRNQSQYMVSVRETIESQCSGTGIFFYADMSYRIPNYPDKVYTDFSIQSHGYYVIRLNKQNDKLILKLRIPELSVPQIFCPEHATVHSKMLQTYEITCRNEVIADYFASQRWVPFQKQFDDLEKKIQDIS
jgi:hypothetical protein